MYAMRIHIFEYPFFTRLQINKYFKFTTTRTGVTNSKNLLYKLFFITILLCCDLWVFVLFCTQVCLCVYVNGGENRDLIIIIKALQKFLYLILFIAFTITFAHLTDWRSDCRTVCWCCLCICWLASFDCASLNQLSL